jgi:8-oxo-dGTP pyrophosphatase MutT (NUDIX family)
MKRQILKSSSRAPQSEPVPFYKLSRLRKLKGSEQVAAVCYRVRGGCPQFLLVNTRGGRWIFPKGSTESGLSPAQAAALEAFEEAGVHGRMEETCFARFTHLKAGGGHRRRPSRELSVRAYLCQVTRLGSPKERDRKPMWFSPAKARRRLEQNRTLVGAAELVRVLNLALNRIPQFEQRLIASEMNLRIPFQFAYTRGATWRSSPNTAKCRQLGPRQTVRSLPLLVGTVTVPSI